MYKSKEKHFFNLIQIYLYNTFHNKGSFPKQLCGKTLPCKPPVSKILENCGVGLYLDVGVVVRAGDAVLIMACYSLVCFLSPLFYSTDHSCKGRNPILSEYTGSGCFFLHPVNYNQRPSIQYSWEVKRCPDSLKRISKRTDLNQLLNFLTVQTLFISPLYAHSLLSVFFHGYPMWTHFVVTGGVRVSFSLSVLTANSLFPPWLRHFTDRQKTSGLYCKYTWRRKMREEGETGRYHCHTERLDSPKNVLTMVHLHAESTDNSSLS